MLRRTDPAGKMLAAGTPERVVRLWDPRVGDKSIGKLIGHSDCVRSVLVSEDGRHVSRRDTTTIPRLIVIQMLTGSSDTTVK
jgi:WD repeat-containing protein 48